MARDKHILVAGVRELHAIVREVRTLLTNPTAETLDACRTRLEEAVQALGRLQSSLASRDSSPDRAMASQLAAMRTEIAGIQILLDSIAAVVIGGASLFGGSGTVVGTVIGALIIAVIQYGLVFVNVEPFWQFVAVGVVIIISVLVDQIQKQVGRNGPNG